MVVLKNMIVVVLGVLGLVFGSFLNASVWRVHAALDGKKIVSKSFLSDRSYCPDCKHTLGALDLIPLVSWIRTQGQVSILQKTD